VISKLVLSTSIGVDFLGLESVFVFYFLLPSCFSAANSFCLSCHFVRFFSIFQQCNN
jgi:hypothetical protein